MDQETPPLDNSSMWHFQSVLPTNNQRHPNPELTAPVALVPVAGYPIPAILPANIQQAYTVDWRDKAGQGSSQGMFPRTSWLGQWEFKATVLESKDRGAPYSWQGDEVYVNVHNRMPVTVSTTGQVPPGSYVRAYLVFRDPSLHEPVQRCAKHQSEDKDSPISEHWIRAHPDCNPMYGVADGVHYVDIPYDKLMEDSQHKWAVYNFQCYSSCVEKTGFRRKRKASTATRFPPLRLMLQLIMGGPQCQLLGRDGIDIRVCACPGRDRGKEDGPKRKAKAPSPPSPQSLGPHGGKRKGKGKARPATPPPTEPQRVPTTVEVDLTIPSAKVQRVSVKGQEYYHLQLYVPVERREMKEAHLSLDLATRTS